MQNQSCVPGVPPPSSTVAAVESASPCATNRKCEPLPSWLKRDPSSQSGPISVTLVRCEWLELQASDGIGLGAAAGVSLGIAIGVASETHAPEMHEVPLTHEVVLAVPHEVSLLSNDDAEALPAAAPSVTEAGHKRSHHG